MYFKQKYEKLQGCSNISYNLGQNEWNISTTPALKWRVSVFVRLHHCFAVGGREGRGLIDPFSVQDLILDKMNGTFRPPLPPISMMLKWRVSVFVRLHHCFAGGGGKGVNCSFFCPRFNLGQNEWNISTTPPPPPHFNDAKMAGFVFLRAFIIALGRKGVNCSFSFYSVQDCRLEGITILWIQ